MAAVLIRILCLVPPQDDKLSHDECTRQSTLEQYPYYFNSLDTMRTRGTHTQYVCIICNVRARMFVYSKLVLVTASSYCTSQSIYTNTPSQYYYVCILLSQQLVRWILISTLVLLLCQGIRSHAQLYMMYRNQESKFFLIQAISIKIADFDTFDILQNYKNCIIFTTSWPRSICKQARTSITIT